MAKTIVYGNGRVRAVPDAAHARHERSAGDAGAWPSGISARHVRLALMQIACAANAAASLARQGLGDAEGRSESLLQVLAFQLQGIGALADEIASGEVGIGVADWLVGPAFATACHQGRP